MGEGGDYTTTERVGLVVWWLAHGDGMSVADAVKLTGLSRQGAWDMLCRLSRVLPIYSHRGVWQACALRELEDILAQP